ncbi:hypothetical protein [Aureispira sp. CCB-E]|uniref:hypothetical protein n=1 Tax=Aureispira sp. CCB-E TaxID=3051121 RepID=UPI0028686F97|nr:hypothetical protein [Aureispira sp. CCB-E]WMX12383.1 hypothetical protein QP953_16255 [Aureispira sp. CCB-E]
MEKPKICTLDLDETSTSLLTDNEFNLYIGSLGVRTKVPNNRRGDSHYCLPSLNYPQNLHEYDIIIVDLKNKEAVEWKFENHQRKEISSNSIIKVVSAYPETIFNSKALGLHLLEKDISSFPQKVLFIVFADEKTETEYKFVSITDSFTDTLPKEVYSNYSFTKFPYIQNKYGEETIIANSIDSELAQILSKYNAKATYHVIFDFPEIRDKETNKYVPNPYFKPLMLNNTKQIVSFRHLFNDMTLFVFPQFENKGEFLLDFLKNYAPNISPELFPSIIKDNWTLNENYFLPNHKLILQKIESEKKRHKQKIKELEDELNENYDSHAFLHTMLIATGDELVTAMLKYLQWLGFTNAVDADSINSELIVAGKKVKEEDIQIETDKGLIIIEVKGIGGTSKDSECSQISKVKYRRGKKRQSYDVYAHYIVNHQRHIPPLQRENPPFSKEQLNDAKIEERGLITTWQLFKLYFLIEKNILTKAKARQKFYLQNGLFDLKPECKYLNKTEEIFKEGKVIILNIKGTEIKVGDELLIEKDDDFNIVKIKSIQIDNKPVSKTSNGEIGLSLDKPVQKNSLVYLLK